MRIVTLISDLALGDGKVSSVKCQLYEKIDDLVIVDVTHKVFPFDIGKAAWTLMESFRHFPAGTVHLVAVDTEVGFRPRILCACVEGHYIVAPDNGILSLAFGNNLTEVFDAGDIDYTKGSLGWFGQAAELSANLFAGSEPGLFLRKTNLQTLPRFTPPQQIGDYLVECSVLDIDRFGNVILNITRKQFDEYNHDRKFRIVLPLEYDIDEVEQNDAIGLPRQPLEIKQLSNNYVDVEEGMPLCLFNYSGFLEIAVNGGNASNKFKLKPLFYHDLRYLRVAIRFEQ